MKTMSMNEKQIIDAFHKIYYEKEIWKNTYWMGVRVQKTPLDLWIYQELLYKIMPDIIIETGTAYGGSAYYLAHICDILGKGKVFTIDIEQDRNRPFHQRIKYILGSSADPEIVKLIESGMYPTDRVLVILDSDHTKDHVIKELEIYNKFVTSGSYLIVEDSNINDHPVFPEFGSGPMEAINEFLTSNKDFVVDNNCEKFMLTFNPKGYLKCQR